jgi:molecular chaperone GrpE
MKHKKSHKPDKEEPKAGEAEELRRQLEVLQKEKDEIFGKLQRVGADYDNFQKRVPKQIADNIAYEKERIIKTFLPVLDNFEHTLQNSHSSENADALVKGIRIVYDQMLDILRGHGVEQIAALGESFDPAFHEAVMQREEPDQPEGAVLEEFQKGYTLNGRVIRPSKVIVNKPASQQADEQEPADYETTDAEDETQ